MLDGTALGELAIGDVSPVNKYIVADVAALTISGNDANLYATRYLMAEGVSLTLTFHDADFIRASKGLRVIGGGGGRGLRASAGGGGSGLRIRA